MQKNIGDLRKERLERDWYGSKLQQKLFGYLAEEKQFLELTEGEILIRPR